MSGQQAVVVLLLASMPSLPLSFIQSVSPFFLFFFLWLSSYLSSSLTVMPVSSSLLSSQSYTLLPCKLIFPIHHPLNPLPFSSSALDQFPVIIPSSQITVLLISEFKSKHISYFPEMLRLYFFCSIFV